MEVVVVIAVVMAVLQLAGAFLLLAGFIAAQAGVRDTTLGFLVVNTVGSAILAVVAIAGRDWGFTALEGTWAIVSAIGLARRPWRHTQRPATSLVRAPDSPATLRSRRPAAGEPQDSRSRRWEELLPPERTVRLAGDELSTPGRLIRLFRDSYSGAQGRQWLQPHIVWWMLLFLRRNGIHADWDVVDSPELAERVTSLDLPAGHTDVHPTEQTTQNFGLWWPLVRELIARTHHPRPPHRPWRLAWQPNWRRTLSWLVRQARRRDWLPDTVQLDSRAWQLGLRPWMSSATYEEIAGISRALATIDHHNGQRRGSAASDADDFMVAVLLPGLLIVELRWIHTPGGRPRPGHRTDVVLWQRYHAARAKWTHGRYLTACDHMYLRAGDILNSLTEHPASSTRDPALRAIADLHRQLTNDHHHRHDNATTSGAADDSAARAAGATGRPDRMPEAVP